MALQAKLVRKDADFNNYVNIVVPYLNTNKARLVITVVALADLTQLTAALSTAVTGWNTVYPQSQNPAVCTSSIINQKNTLRVQIEALLRAIFADIPKSVLTQVDRDTLNLPLPSGTYTPATKPTKIPSLSVNGRGYLTVTINAVDTDSPQFLAKPDGVDSIQFESAFLPIGTSPSAGFPQESDFRNLATSGKSSYNRTYTQDQLQGTDYIRARYLNTRKEPGNWSQPISIIVS